MFSNILMGFFSKPAVRVAAIAIFLVLPAGRAAADKPALWERFDGPGAGGPSPSGLRAGAGEDPLPVILEKTKAYCRRLGGASLYFICKERIDERQFKPPLRMFSTIASAGRRRVDSLSLEYDYQLVRNGESIEEKRILLKENGQRRNEPDAELATKLYRHKYLVFGPVALFSEFRQPKHTYAYLGEDTVDGEKVYLVEAGPTGPPEPELLYGKVWVRQRDFAIVKIAWDQRSLGNYDLVLQTARALGHEAAPKIAMVGYYGVEKNGVRFPDRVTIHEDYDSTRGTFRVSETAVVYKDYKFFIVETEVRQ